MSPRLLNCSSWGSITFMHWYCNFFIFPVSINSGIVFIDSGFNDPKIDKL